MNEAFATHTHTHPPPLGRFDDASLKHIFSKIVSWWLNKFPSVSRIAPQLVKGSIALYRRLCSGLMPTPTKSHYVFNLRDLRKVFEPILPTNPTPNLNPHPEPKPGPKSYTHSDPISLLAVNPIRPNFIPNSSLVCVYLFYLL